MSAARLRPVCFALFSLLLSTLTLGCGKVDSCAVGATGCLVLFIVAQSFWLAKYMKEDNQ